MRVFSSGRFSVAEMMAVSGWADAVVISHFTMVASITAFLRHDRFLSTTTTASSPISRSSGLASLTGTQTTMTRIFHGEPGYDANKSNILTSHPCLLNRNSPDAQTTSPRWRE